MSYIIVSLNLPRQILPDCFCATGEPVTIITILRTTKGYSDEESFTIRDSTYNTKFTQPSISDNSQYTWSATVCEGEASIIMTDSYEDGWDTGSNVEIKKGSTSLGVFRCSDGARETKTFTV